MHGICNHVISRTSETEHTHALASAISSVNDDDDDEEEDEEEEIPDDIADLTPAQQQTVIKRRAFTTLAVGTAVVLIFSDPMVDVMSEIGARTGISPFYVSFVLAPLASNASELIAAYSYALKKTQKSVTISFTALEGAACMVSLRFPSTHTHTCIP